MRVACPHHEDAVRGRAANTTHIRASNKISNTISTQGGNRGYSKQRGPSYRGSHSTSTGRNFFRENLSDEPAEQARSEQPELTPEEKISQ